MSIFIFWIFLFNTKKFPWFPYLKKSFTLFFCKTMVELWSFITSCFWGPAHCSYCKHQKTALDSLSNYQVLSNFGIGNIICDDPTTSILHSGLLSCCYGSLTPNWIMLSPILMAKTYSSGLCSWRENNGIKRWSLILILLDYLPFVKKIFVFWLWFSFL